MTIPEPYEVAQLVEFYVDKSFADAERWDNANLLDDSGVFGLHQLAAKIYAKGFEHGASVEAERERGRRKRESK